jgi:hypothetical protein
VALDPTLAEAHLRLGHCCCSPARWTEADAALRALGADRRSALALPRGELRADARRRARGSAPRRDCRYQAAAAWPDAQSPSWR